MDERHESTKLPIFSHRAKQVQSSLRSGVFIFRLADNPPQKPLTRCVICEEAAKSKLSADFVSL
jgi:hypothetical protein